MADIKLERGYGTLGDWNLGFRINGVLHWYSTWDKAIYNEIRYISNVRKSPGKALNHAKKYCFYIGTDKNKEEKEKEKGMEQQEFNFMKDIK